MTNNDIQITLPDAARVFARQAVEQLRVESETVSKPADAPLATVLTFPSGYDRTSLIQICTHGDFAALQELITSKTKFDIDSALLWSAQSGQMPLVRLLLNHGADAVALGSDALVWAAHGDHIEIVYLLHQHGASLERLEPDEKRAYDAYANEQAQITATESAARDAAQALALQTLTEIFTTNTWAGHVPEMIKLWSEVPEPLKNTFDFSHVLSQTNLHTLKQRKPKIILVK